MAKGTIIGKTTFKQDLKAVAAKDNITIVKIIASEMLLAYGFLKKVFEIFEKHKTPVDLISTSEVTISMEQALEVSAW